METLLSFIDQIPAAALAVLAGLQWAWWILRP